MSSHPTLKLRAVIGEWYTLREPIADWGAGEAWAADDRRFEGRVVVIKFLPKGDEALAEVVGARMEAVRTLRHPNVLPLIDHGVWAGRYYAVHEHAPLRSLGTWLDEHRALEQLPPLGELKTLFAQTCEALAAGRQESVPALHEGISPASVMLRGTDDLQARVIDFAIVRFADPIEAAEGSSRGVACMAPEQFQGEEADARTDVFGLALLLMEMLAALPDPAAPPGRYRGRGDVPEAVWHVLQRAIRTNRDERFSTVDALLNAITAAWEVTSDARPHPPSEAAADAPTADAPTADAPTADAPTADAGEPSAQAPRLLHDDAPAPTPDDPSRWIPLTAPASAEEHLVLPALAIATGPAVAPPAVAHPAVARPAVAHPAVAAPDVAEAPALDDIEARTVAIPRPDFGPIDEFLGVNRTVAMDFNELFPGAEGGEADCLATMRSNRDPKARAEITQRYRAQALAAVQAKQAQAQAQPFEIAPPRAPAAAPREPEPRPAPAPAPALAPAPGLAVEAPDDEAPDSRRGLLMAGVVAGFVVTLIVVWLIFHRGH